MVSTQGRPKRALALSVASLLLVAACAGPGPTTAPTGTPAATGTTAPGPTGTTGPGPTATVGPTTAPTPTPPPSGPQKGGTLYMLMSTAVANGGPQFQDMDPQRMYTGEDMAFFYATMQRGLTAYVYDPDAAAASALVADAATDTGTPSDGGKTWQFTVRDDVMWQDGSHVTCEDFKYGVSRTFATDVITNGPTYAIQYLDIGSDADGNSLYPGPYAADEDQQALFDAAVSCDGSTITFHLGKPIADFNYTVTLGFGAVPNPVDHPYVDTGELYTVTPWSDGPYMIDHFSPGIGGEMTLVRNPYWDAATDTYRGAYPDEWVIKFGIDPVILDQRLMTPTGDDSFAVAYGNVQPQNLGTVFADPHTAADAFAGRAFSDFDPYSRYYFIRTDKITNVLMRQAIQVAIDREAIHTAAGGDFTGDYADGVIKPNIGMDYAPTGLWTADGPFGKEIPPAGDPDLAMSLIEQSGEQPGTITWGYVSSPVADQVAAIVQSSLQAVGFTVELNAIPSGYYGVQQNPDTQTDMGGAGWGPDWPNASTVIPPLFVPEGGFDLSRTGPDTTPEFYDRAIANLSQLDRQAQATEWQALNQYAAENAFVVPTFFGLAQNLAGDKVGGLYRWGPYGSWPYAQLYVMP